MHFSDLTIFIKFVKSHFINLTFKITREKKKLRQIGSKLNNHTLYFSVMNLLFLRNELQLKLLQSYYRDRTVSPI